MKRREGEGEAEKVVLQRLTAYCSSAISSGHRRFTGSLCHCRFGFRVASGGAHRPRSLRLRDGGARCEDGNPDTCTQKQHSHPHRHHHQRPAPPWKPFAAWSNLLPAAHSTTASRSAAREGSDTNHIGAGPIKSNVTSPRCLNQGHLHHTPFRTKNCIPIRATPSHSRLSPACHRHLLSQFTPVPNYIYQMQQTRWARCIPLI